MRNVDAAPERAVERAPAVRSSRTRSLRHASAIIDAARRLVAERDGEFTTQELVKEAGVALQTFYRYFATKDELLIAVLGELVAAGGSRLAERARALPGPVERLRYYVSSTMDTLDGDERAVASGRFIVSTHWDLQRRYPGEIAEAMQPFADLLEAEIREAADAGLLRPADPAQAAWFINKLLQSTFHHYVYATDKPATLREDLWQFCLASLGGAPV